MSSIIISQNQQHSRRIDESSFGKEDSLQSYPYDNPDIIPIYDIDEDARLYIAAREFSTEHGPIDALGFDHVGNVYIIETKLFRNADKRRVVAQMLDYGAALWRHATSFDAFCNRLIRTRKIISVIHSASIMSSFLALMMRANKCLPCGIIWPRAI